MQKMLLLSFTYRMLSLHNRDLVLDLVLHLNWFWLQYKVVVVIALAI